jgi:hypothetical protein
MFIALRHLIRQENSIVMWLDTTQDTHFSRKLQAARSAALSSVSPDEAIGNDTAMDRLQIAKTVDAKAASTALNGIARVLAAQETAHRARPDSHVLRTRMIVVDSIADLFVPELKDKTGQGRLSSTGLKQTRVLTGDNRTCEDDRVHVSAKRYVAKVSSICIGTVQPFRYCWDQNYICCRLSTAPLVFLHQANRLVN